MEQNYRGARIANVVLGFWLLMSAFAWPHSLAQETNTWIVGIVIGVVALIGMRTEAIRFINTAVSIWLFISALVLPTLAVGTAWNNAIVAIATFVLSLVGSYHVHRTMPRTTGSS